MYIISVGIKNLKIRVIEPNHIGI